MNQIIKKILDTPISDWSLNQSIILDWHDGPREAFIKLKVPDSIELYLSLLDERPCQDDLDDRIFMAHIIPNGTFDEIMNDLRFLGTPITGIWSPVWKSDDKIALDKAKAAIDSAKKSVKFEGLIVASKDLKKFIGSWMINRIELGKINWFNRLNI